MRGKVLSVRRNSIMNSSTTEVVRSIYLFDVSSQTAVGGRGGASQISPRDPHAPLRAGRKEHLPLAPLSPKHREKPGNKRLRSNKRLRESCYVVRSSLITAPSPGRSRLSSTPALVGLDGAPREARGHVRVTNQRYVAARARSLGTNYRTVPDRLYF